MGNNDEHHRGENMKKKMKATLWVSFLVVLGAASAVTAWSIQKTESAFLRRNGLYGLSVKEMVEKLDRSGALLRCMKVVLRHYCKLFRRFSRHQALLG